MANIPSKHLIEQLNDELLKRPSVTETLEKWCQSHHAGDPQRLTATCVPDIAVPVTASQRRLLAVDADEPVSHRYVRLTSGERSLAVAYNWFVPALLTPAMNRMLQETNVPFGRVVEKLNFHRHIISTETLCPPIALRDDQSEFTLPEDEVHAGIFAIIRHKALLLNENDRPFSLVTEIFTSNIFDEVVL